MENLVSLYTFYCIFLLLLHEGLSLRCRNRSQQMDAQFQKILKSCAMHYNSQNSNGSEDSIFTEDSNLGSASYFEETVYDKNIFNKKIEAPSYNHSSNNQRYRKSNKKFDMNTYSSAYETSESTRHFENTAHIRKINDRGSLKWSNGKHDFYNGSINKDSMQTSNNNNNNHNGENDDGNEDVTDDDNNNNNNNNINIGQEQSCIMQCFFNELDVVDQRGFPERVLAIQLVNRDISDPELKDFVEESITECFRFLESNKQEKCRFSQMLLICLAEKGKQKCEDWVK